LIIFTEKILLNKKNTGVQEFRIFLNPGQSGDRSDLTGLFLGYNNPPLKFFQWLP